MKKSPAVTHLTLALALVLSACGESQTGGPDTSQPGEMSTTTTPDSPTTTQPPPTTPGTTLAPTTTTKPPAAPTTTKPPSSVLDEAEGSGCTPGPGELGDGKWFGFVGTTAEDQIEFDLACWFSGDAAARAAKEDGEESPPPNDYYIRNNNTLIRALAVTESAEVVWYPQLGDPTSEATTNYRDWMKGIEQRDFMPGIWVVIKNGVVTHIQEQWVP